MTALSPSFEALIQALRCLPGVGPKSAQRMALHLLERQPDAAKSLVLALQTALDTVQHCQLCRALSDTAICARCNDQQRQQHLLCIVEMASDILIIEQATHYQGLFFVLSGHLSPLDGIGPDALGLPQLSQRFQEGRITEVILATNPTVEGEATAHYIAELAKQYAITVTRLASGIPMGGELEYIDSNTLSRAFSARKMID